MTISFGLQLLREEIKAEKAWFELRPIEGNGGVPAKAAYALSGFLKYYDGVEGRETAQFLQKYNPLLKLGGISYEGTAAVRRLEEIHNSGSLTIRGSLFRRNVENDGPRSPGLTESTMPIAETPTKASSPRLKGKLVDATKGFNPGGSGS